MPELPEVETIRRTLTPRVVGKVIERVEVRTPKFIVGATPEEFTEAVTGMRIAHLGRRGKFLIISLDGENEGADDDGERGGRQAVRNGSQPSRDAQGEDGDFGDIVIHLKMAGQLIWCEPGTDLGDTQSRHTHVIFSLSGGRELRYVDVRHFGRIYLAAGDRSDPVLRRALETLKGLGPEPRPGQLEWPNFRKALASRNARIKPLLLDQSFVAGLGNIYADECLFRARIHPLRKASSLSDDEARALYEAMRAVIAEAIELRGTSVRDYVDGEGRRGGFAERLAAYGRTGEPCLRCGSDIQREVIGGRSSHFCPRCQPVRSGVRRDNHPGSRTGDRGSR